MAVRIVRLGTPRQTGEGVRIGTVRFPPRGVRKEDLALENYYDVWFPNLAPSAALLAKGKSAASERDWKQFVRRYRAEMKAPDARRVLDVLAALSHESDFSVGCYCAEEARCHRSVLRELLAEHGADVHAG